MDFINRIASCSCGQEITSPLWAFDSSNRRCVYARAFHGTTFVCVPIQGISEMASRRKGGVFTEIYVVPCLHQPCCMDQKGTEVLRQIQALELPSVEGLGCLFPMCTMSLSNLVNAKRICLVGDIAHEATCLNVVDLLKVSKLKPLDDTYHLVCMRLVYILSTLNQQDRAMCVEILSMIRVVKHR